MLKEWKTLLWVGVVGGVVGVVMALCNPKEYTAVVTLAPEFQEDTLAIHPKIYPDLMGSEDFVNALRVMPVRTVQGEVMPYEQHIKHFKKPFWKLPKIWLAKLLRPKEIKLQGNGAANGKDPYYTTRFDYEMNAAIGMLISCKVDKKTEVVTIRVKDQDPLVAAIVADSAQTRLQNYIKQYKTEKARVDYTYYQQRCVAALKEYEAAAAAYTSYAEQYQQASLPSYKVRGDELRNEMNARYGTYMNAQAQMHRAEEKIQEQTPAFVIMNHPKMPQQASSRPRSVQVILWLLLFEICACCVIGYKKL